MNLRDLIAGIRKEGNYSEVEDYFIANPNDINTLVQFVINHEPYPIEEYASWVLLHISKRKPERVRGFYNSLIDVSFSTSNQSVLRNVICIIDNLSISSYRESEFIDLLIKFIQNPKNKVALQVYSIYVLIQFVTKYPELHAEIKQVIDINETEKSPAYKVAKRNFQLKTKNI